MTSGIRRVITERPDFTYGSAEEYEFCRWVVATQQVSASPATPGAVIPTSRAWERWLEAREAWLLAAGWGYPANAPDARDRAQPTDTAARRIRYYRAVLTAAIEADYQAAAEEARKWLAFWEKRHQTILGNAP